MPVKMYFDCIDIGI